MATLIGPVLNQLGVPPLAAHFFIFYFGMMSMVTPPVALAAYASASIAGSGIMSTGLAAFRFSLVGFTLPYMFVYRPELLLMAREGETLSILGVVIAITAAVVGITSLAGGLAGYLFARLGILSRLALFIAAALALFPDSRQIPGTHISVLDLAGTAILTVIAILSLKSARRNKVAASLS